MRVYLFMCMYVRTFETSSGFFFTLMQTKEMELAVVPFHKFADSGGDNMSTSAAST